MPENPRAVAMMCEKCRKRRHHWFTDEGYLCNVCNDELLERQGEAEHAARIERFRKALMEAHADDWSMETIAEAANICAEAERLKGSMSTSGEGTNDDQ